MTLKGLIDRMRNKRAMFAGLGTATMLAGAVACVFVLGSAVVAFRAWPGGSADSPQMNNQALIVRDDVRAQRTHLASQQAQARDAAIAARQRAARSARRDRARTLARRERRQERLRSRGAQAPTTSTRSTDRAAVPGADATPPQVSPPATAPPKPAPGPPPSQPTDDVRRPSSLTGSADYQLDVIGERVGGQLNQINPVVGTTVRHVADQLGDVIAGAGRGLDRGVRSIVAPR